MGGAQFIMGASIRTVTIWLWLDHKSLFLTLGHSQPRELCEDGLGPTNYPSINQAVTRS